METKLLIIEDDRFIHEKLLKLLASEGYSAHGCESGEEALVYLEKNPVDMIILDLGLPGMDGLTTCRRIRQKWKVPLLMLTSRAAALDRVLGLESGADDYLPKPFDARELMARVRAHLRRTLEYQSEAMPHAFELEGLVIDFERRMVSVAGAPVELTSKEFELLAYLASNKDRAISREQLFDKVWGYDEEFCTNSLEVHVYRLRKKIEPAADSPRLLHTVRGYGYRFGQSA